MSKLGLGVGLGGCPSFCCTKLHTPQATVALQVRLAQRNRTIERLLFRLFLRVRVGQPELEIRLAVMAGESIYANVRLRLTANRTYELQ